MTRSGRVCALAAALLIAGAVVVIARLGEEHATVAESGASLDFAGFEKLWAGTEAPPPVEIGKGLLPPSLPGPGDAWAGGRFHAVPLNVDLPPGRYRLELAFFEIHDTAPPTISIELNGRPLRDARLRAGAGKPPPYAAIDPELTLIVPFEAAAARSAFVLTNRAGSWFAPARVRISSAQPSFNPAKAAYLLLARTRHLLVLAGLLLGAVFCGVCARRGPREAGAAVLLLAVSLAAASALAEAAFREWLIRKPGKRAVWTPQDRLGREGARNYTYVTMIRPSGVSGVPYEMKSHLDGVFAHHPLSTNSLGMRGPELEGEPGPATVRIVGLGDSVMMGWGVSYDETALARLGRRLAAATGRTVETANLGCPSYNTAVETAVYAAKGRRLRPDLVVLVVLDNDFGFPGFVLEPVVRTTLRKSYLLEQLRRRLVPHWSGANDYERGEELITSRQFDALQAREQGERTPRERWLETVREHYRHMITEEGVRNSLAELAAMVREDGAAGVVVYDAVNLTVDEPASYEKRASWVVTTARELGFAAIDMTPIFEDYLRRAGLRRMQEALWVSDEDWHPNAEGHRLIAEAVAELVLQKDLLGKSPPR